MTMRNLLAIIAFLIGEGVIIGTFVMFGEPLLPGKVLALDIVVASIIYCLYMIDLFIPWIDLGDKAHRQVGSLGVRWMVNLLYTVLAMTTIIVGARMTLSFGVQLLIQIALLGLLALGYSGVLGLQDKVNSVHEREEELYKAFEERKRNF